MKHRVSAFLATATAVGALLAPLAASAVAQDGAATDWTCPEGFEGQRLSVYNWTTYIAEDTISNFEELCGVDVTYDTYPTDDAMLARIRQGNPGYDIVVPSATVAYLMVDEGLFLPLDEDAIPNRANLLPNFTGLGYDPEDEFTVPYQWGTMGIGYNVETAGEIDSWADVFAHEGPVAWLDDTRGMLGSALSVLGLDPNTRDPDEVARARDFLIENGGNVVYIAGDDGQEVLARGEADIVVEYSGDIYQIIADCECDTYAYVIPEEGSLFWVDVVGIPVGAPNPELANVFIDYLLDPQVSADISNYTAYGSPNAVAIEQGLIAEEYLSDPGVYPSQETLDNMFFVEQDDELETLYNDAWDELRILIGG